MSMKKNHSLKNNTKYRHLYNSMSQGVVYQNADGYITEANPAAQRLLGLTLAQLQGRKSIDPRWKAIRKDGSDFPGEQHPAMRALKTGETIKNEIMGVYHPNKGTHVWILVSAEPITTNSSEEPVEVFATFTDVTDQIIAEKRLNHQSELQTILTDISGSFINTIDDSPDSVINKSLEMLGGYMNADRIYIFDYEHDTKNIRNTYEWCNKGVLPQIDHLQEVSFSMVPDWVKAHFKGETMNIADVYSLDKEDGVRQVLEPQGIKSLITVPIIDHQKCIGFVGIDSVADHKTYGDIDEKILKIYTRLLLNLYKQISNRQEILEKQNFLEDIFQSANSIIAIKNLTGEYLFANKKMEEITGIPSKVIIGKHDEDIFSNADSSLYRENDLKAIKKDNVVEVEEKLELENNKTKKYFISNKFPVKNHKGEITGLCIISSEITERKNAEKKLKRINARLQNLVNSQTNYVLRVDLKGNFNYANHKYVEDFGWLYNNQEITGALALKSIRKYHHKRAEDAVEFCVKHPGTIKKVELDKPLQNGDTQTSLWEFVCLKDDNGAPSEIQCVGFDITEQKKNQEQIRLLSEVIEQSPMHVVITNPNGNIEYINSSLLNKLGYSEEELIGKKTSIWKSGHHSEEFYENLWSTIKSGNKWTGEFYNKTKNGEFFWEKAVVSPITDDQGGIKHYVGVKEDVTIKKLAEEERIARKEAQASNEAKSKFLSRISHEFRTPLHAIMSYSYILKKDEIFNNKQNKQLQAIIRSGNHLLQLIEDILDYSKIEKNNIEIKYQTFNPQELIEDIKLMFNQRAIDKGIYFDSEAEDLPNFITADEGKIRQVIVNILGNAIKFTSKGGVKVKAQAKLRDGKEKAIILISVKDTGPGMTKGEIDQVFTEFKQFSAGEKEGGTGLGMSISKGLVDAMNGTLTIESEPGAGTLMRIELPVDITDMGNLPKSIKNSDTAAFDKYGESTNQDHITLLIVDDNEDNRDTLYDLLEPYGYTIYTAIDGYEGIKKAKQVRPNIILMDIQMPGLNGYETSHKIKKEPFGQKTKIIAVTASEYEKDEERLSDNGLEDYLRKPFQPDDLFEKIQYWISRID